VGEGEEWRRFSPTGIFPRRGRDNLGHGHPAPEAYTSERALDGWVDLIWPGMTLSKLEGNLVEVSHLE
jgi:hypothetical protein